MPRFDEALSLVRNEFGGLDAGSQYRNAFARLSKPDPLRRVSMLGTDQRDLLVPILRELVPEAVPEGGRVLDIGGGNGQTFALLADRIPPGVEVSLIEPNTGYVKDYVGRLEQQPHLVEGTVINDGFDQAVAPPYVLPDDGTVDLVLAMHMLYFIADPAVSLVRMARFVGPGGVLVVVVADEVWGYTGQALRSFVEAGGDTGNNTAHLASVLLRHQLMTTDLGDVLAEGIPGAVFEVETQLQPSRMYGHTLSDLIALSSTAELASVMNTTKFDAAAELLRRNPQGVDLRIEDEGPRKGMWSVSQPQHLAVVRRSS